jgi:hypothetical protein
VLIGAAALPTKDTWAAAEPAAGFAGITELNCVLQGQTVASRIGNKITMKSAHLRFDLSAAAAILADVRVMVLYDRQPNGAFPALADILVDQPAGVVAPFAGINIANKSRFLMLRDQDFLLDQGQASIHCVNMYIKGRWETEFGSTLNAITDFRTGALYLCVFTTFASGNVAISNGTCRIRYYD